MDLAIVVAAVIAAVLGLGLIIRIARPGTPRSGSAERSRLVTGNLDYSILGQRPEIVTEDEPPVSGSGR